jgi:NADPH2:quinone reductase
VRALRFRAFGGFEQLRVEELPDPHPNMGEVIVRVHAASLNPSDAKNVFGRMEGTTLPRTPGRDFAGVVVHGPAELLGQDVWGTGGDVGFTRDGTHAEFIVVPADGVRPKPKNLSFEEAATVGVTFVAAWIGLVETAHVQAGEWVLATGAAGSVGSAVTQIAKSKGGFTIGADRTALSAERQRESSIDQYVIADSDNEYKSLVDAVHQFTKGRGVDVSFDAVGGPLFEPCLRSLGQRGRQVNITSVGNRRVSFDLLDFYHRQLTLVGVDTRAYDTSASARILERLTPSFENGALRPAPIARCFSLEEASEAYHAVDTGSLQGKAVFVFAA